MLARASAARGRQSAAQVFGYRRPSRCHGVSTFLIEKKKSSGLWAAWALSRNVGIHRRDLDVSGFEPSRAQSNHQPAFVQACWAERAEPDRVLSCCYYDARGLAFRVQAHQENLQLSSSRVLSCIEKENIMLPYIETTSERFL